MKLHTYKLLLLLFVGLLSSCEEDITDKVNIDSTRQLVITSFISPQDTALIVRVNKTQPAIGKTETAESLLISNATVNLSNGSQTIKLTYDPIRKLYRARATQLPIISGRTYTLTATTPDGFSTSGTCTVPALNGILIQDLSHSVEQITYDAGPDKYVYNRHTFTFKWQDAPGRGNYYHALTLREFKENFNNKTYRMPLDAYEVEKYFSDENQDGGTFSTSGQYTTSTNENEPSPNILRAHLSVTDRHYYLYHKTIEQQRETNANPFAEPTFIYTNIKGGLGVFAAYNQMQRSIVVP
ncbi:DUF4249 domain-containing protein [Adhaeribacter aquaticus]|uniref:DUF4249 domain-containing protein n=1 Tax=Adhaeribacter aquaticus TaxID=299567 RepID=UPI00047E774C|nr:DUF4249 domain-containing protein [Adhaeribacter aquaticus]